MASFSAINNIGMGINANLLTEVLKKKEGFDGFIISDYDDISVIASQGLPTSAVQMTYYQATCIMANAGIDMFMLPVADGNVILNFQDSLK